MECRKPTTPNNTIPLNKLLIIYHNIVFLIEKCLHNFSSRNIFTNITFLSSGRSSISFLRRCDPGSEGGQQPPGAQLLHETAQLAIVQRSSFQKRTPTHSGRLS